MPPSHIGDCLKIIYAQKSQLLAEALLPPLEILALLKRLDPFRRLDRALTILDSVPQNACKHKALWIKLCHSLHHLDISAVIAGSAPHERQALIEAARLQLIKDLIP